jgi:hypothetical protein
MSPVVISTRLEQPFKTRVSCARSSHPDIQHLPDIQRPPSLCSTMTHHPTMEYPSFKVFFLDTVSSVTQVGIKLTKLPKLASNSQQLSCLRFLSAIGYRQESPYLDRTHFWLPYTSNSPYVVPASCLPPEHPHTGLCFCFLATCVCLYPILSQVITQKYGKNFSL